MNTATRPAYPVTYDGTDRYDWNHHHHWHGHHGHGRALWHAGPGLIGLMVLGFLFCWPLGLVALALMIGSAKMMCGHHGARVVGARETGAPAGRSG